MKKTILLILLLYLACANDSFSQHVTVRMDFPGGISVRPLSPPPFRDAIWIGPEWRWDRGRYVCVPGYWSKPIRGRKHWRCGQWRHTRRGYVWVAGRWR